MGPQKAHRCAETRRMTCRSWKFIHWSRRDAIPWIKKVDLRNQTMRHVTCSPRPPMLWH